MDIIRESALFTTLLHCLLAYSLPSNNLPQTTGPYNTISNSFVADILETPSYHKELQTEASNIVSPSGRNDKMAYEAKSNHDDSLLRDIMNNIKQLFQPELPGTTPKGIISNYPLTTPRVKIGIAVNSGMLPVKIHTTHSDKPESAKVLKSTNTDKTTKPMNVVLDGKEDLRKKPEPVEYAKKEIPLEYSTTPISQYGLKSSQNDFSTLLDKPDLSGILLNPINFHQTNPGIEVRKDQVDKPFQYTPSYRVLTGLVSHPYPTHSGIIGNIESVGNDEYTSTFKPDYATDSLKPANVDYIPTKDMFNDNVLTRADEYTASYRYVPEISSKHDVSKDNSHDGLAQSTAPYKENPAINVPKPPIGYSPTKPMGEDEVVLPPVPTSLSVVQRVQIALLNTVAGLPGGIAGALDAVRAK